MWIRIKSQGFQSWYQVKSGIIVEVRLIARTRAGIIITDGTLILPWDNNYPALSFSKFQIGVSTIVQQGTRIRPRRRPQPSHNGRGFEVALWRAC